MREAVAAWLGWGRRAGGHDEEIVELTDQFYVTLEASFARVPGSLATGPAAARVQELLQTKARSWSSAYEIEQRLVQLYDDETVAAELELRAMEATGVLRKEQADHYAARTEALRKAKEPGASQGRRILLARLVNDLQWRYTVNEARRRYSKVVIGRAGWLFVWALAFFSLAIAYKVLCNVTLSLDDLRVFAFAGLGGAWGASFSMLSTLKTRLEASSLDDLKLMRPWVMLASRMLIGAGAACILYFFILSGLLGGTAFPQLATPSEDRRDRPTESVPAPAPAAGEAAATTKPPLPDTTLALLVVWCFIAGFSERLVPGLLARTETRAGTAASSTAASDRYRPTSPLGPPAPTAAAEAAAASTTGESAEAAGPRSGPSGGTVKPEA